MSQARPLSTLATLLGALLLAAGVAVFAIRLQHEGPYAIPGGGNMRAGVLALVLGGWLVRDWLPHSRPAALFTWVALAAAPVVLFFALYATMAEMEEVVTLRAPDRSGEMSDLRLWIVDRDGETWVTMQRSKADEHGLGERVRVELLRDGSYRCVMATRDERRETVNAIHHLRHEKYAVQRIATMLGLFGREAHEHTVALRLEPCPGP